MENLERLFENQANEDLLIDLSDGFFYEDFSGYPVQHYKRIPIPAKPKRNYYNWQHDYGDLASLYELNWGDKIPNQNDEGWNIIRIYYNAGEIRYTIIFPYRVGLKKVEWGNYYTVERAVNDAFEFYRDDADSPFAAHFQNGSVNRLWLKIYDCCNPYYTIKSKGYNNTWYPGESIGTEKFKDPHEAPYEYSWVQNGYYRVYIAATQDEYFVIEEREGVAKEDKNKLLIWWSVGISVLFLSFIIPIAIKEMKSNKRKAESLYQRLLRLCNPKEFIRNYDKEKMDKANRIYQRLINMKPGDEEALKEIVEVAVAELGIMPYGAEELEELKEKVNPKNYFTPYDAEKIALANELYAILTKDGLTYKEFMEVKEKSKSL